MKRYGLIALSLFLVLGCSQSKPETLVTSGYSQQEMDDAIAKARSKVDLFLAELAKPTGTDHAVKVPIEDNGEVEHFWMNEVSFRDGQFEGTINNEPGLVKNVKLGQKWKAKKSDISDWMYMRGEKMVGNYTMVPLLKTLPKEQADGLRALLVNP